MSCELFTRHRGVPLPTASRRPYTTDDPDSALVRSVFRRRDGCIAPATASPTRSCLSS